MTRRESRESAFRIVFLMSVNTMSAEEALGLADGSEELKHDGFAANLVTAVFNHLEDIDRAFAPFLKSWNIERISKPALAILRISCAQLFYWDEIAEADKGVADSRSENIIINEAVELSKRYGTDEDYAFVNGVLGNVVRSPAV